MKLSENPMKIQICSEIGKLEGVILHTPGPEVENMTPQNAERALYSDILNLSVAGVEYEQFRGVLEKVTKVFQVKDLLAETLAEPEVKKFLISRVIENSKVRDIKSYLLEQNAEDLAKLLIEGVPIQNNSLSDYLSRQRFKLEPLHNFFFTRDASSSVLDTVFINRMASPVRIRESLIMESIFDFHPKFIARTANPDLSRHFDSLISMEGGDILVAREDILLIGTGIRTTSQGIDYIARKIESREQTRHIIVQQLPQSPESFIHLDMVFTFLDFDKCMIYKPLILESNKYATIHLTVDNGKITSISEENNIIEALQKLGMPLQPILCGGIERQNQEREQWHSGANFFAFAPGKIIGYERNVHTIEELSKSGFSVVRAKDIIAGKDDLSNYEKVVVTIHGAELSRGGGGARCMTMPVRRENISW